MHPLKVTEPDAPIDPFEQPDEALEWVETLIVEAERQIKGLERGSDRIEAAIDVAVRTVAYPVLGDREVARLAIQLVYSGLARGLPNKFRSGNREAP